MFNICSTVIVMCQQYTCDELCFIICSSYLVEDLQTLSLLFFGSHMAKTKPVLKKPLANKQFTAGHTKPATKLSKKPATKLSKLLQDASEVIGPRPPFKKT